MKGWDGDGIIISSNDPAELRYAKSLDIPVLNLGGGLPSHHGIPRIMNDHYETGQLAAQHLIDCGLTHLAFFGWKHQWYSQERCHGFKDRAAEYGISCDVLLRTAGEDHHFCWSDHMTLLSDWLTSLPHPCGIFAVQDYRAQLLIEACHEVGLRVPYEIAILGMDNDETICEHSSPKISSISRNGYKLGQTAAATLHLMMQGKAIPSAEILIPPEEVVIRASSDMMFCSDPFAGEVIDYMRTHISESCKVMHIAKALGVSKRTLETRFSTVTNSTPHEYLTRMRVYSAQKLMRLDHVRTFSSIVEECGFGASSTFVQAFKRVTGISPADYREKIRNEFPSSD